MVIEIVDTFKINQNISDQHKHKRQTYISIACHITHLAQRHDTYFFMDKKILKIYITIVIYICKE